MFRYICRYHLFASFASYSLPNIRTNSHTNTRFDAKQIHFLILVNIRFKKYVLKLIFAILLRISHSSEYSYTGLWIRIPLFVSAKKYANTIFFLQQNSLNQRIFRIFLCWKFGIRIHVETNEDLHH